MTEQRLVFVGGLHRIGTTPLARCLAAHPQISGFEHTGVEEDEGQHLQTVYPPARAHGGPGRFALSAAAHLTETSPLLTRIRRLSCSSSGRLTGTWPNRCWSRSPRPTW